jgi:uncharacterized protein (TIGR03435 family)
MTNSEQPWFTLRKNKGVFMQTILKKLTISFALTAIAVLAQTKPAFEAATIKPAAPLDQAKIMAAMKAGGKMPVGPNIGTSQAEYTFMDLKSLIARAYSVKPYQITGPDWLATTRFDIVAKMPEGASKDDEPKMLQSLLEDRFKLTTHRTSAEHPVLALVVGKGGPKMKASTEPPTPIDDSVPLKPGEMKMDGPDGPMRIKVDMTNGSSVVDMGVKGKMSYRMNPATQSIHVDLSMVTMNGFADMLTQLFSQLGGGNGRQIVDQTEVKGNYEASLEMSLADMMAMARNAGMDVPGGPGGASGAGNPGSGAAVASDPNNGAQSMTDAVQSMGLKLVSSKAMVDQFVVDHAEKSPTDN